jgi:hypothetical protein
MALGTNMAVFFMLGVTVSVLAGFAAFIFYLMRRATLVADGPDSAAHELRRSDPQEGSA